MQGLVLDCRFQVTAKVGSGAFGEIWTGVDLKQRKNVAIKFENVDMKKQQLFQECNIYLLLQQDPEYQKVALPQVHYYSSSHGKNFMVMDLLEESLEDLLKKCGGKFDEKTVAMVAL